MKKTLNHYLAERDLMKCAEMCFEENKLLRDELCQKTIHVEELYITIKELDDKISTYAESYDNPTDLSNGKIYESLINATEMTPLVEKKSCCNIL